MLKQGGRDKADLLVCDLGQGPVVVKDFLHKAWWVRLLGRLQIAREARAYRLLGATAGIPRFHGRIDRYSIAVEKIDGRPLGIDPERTKNGAARLAQLRAILDRIHAVGLVHWDLRARKNVLITEDERVYVVDFASAFHLRPGGLAHRLLFPRLASVDESAYLKWKRLLGAGDYTEQEWDFVRRHKFWRSLWIFNPRHRPKD